MGFTLPKHQGYLLLLTALLLISSCRQSHGDGDASGALSDHDANPFVDSNAPPPDAPEAPKGIHNAPGYEDHVKSAKGWIKLDTLTMAEVSYMKLPDGKLAPGYLDSTTAGLQFYQWKGVILDVHQAPPEHSLNNNHFSKLPETKVIEVDPPIQFLAVGPSGSALPGYFDSKSSYFYSFAGVTVPRDRVPPVSPQHRHPLIELPKSEEAIRNVSIPIPDHLKKTLAPWTKEPAPASQPATTDTPDPAPAPPAPVKQKLSK